MRFIRSVVKLLAYRYGKRIDQFDRLLNGGDDEGE